MKLRSGLEYEFLDVHREPVAPTDSLEDVVVAECQLTAQLSLAACTTLTSAAIGVRLSVPVDFLDPIVNFVEGLDFLSFSIWGGGVDEEGCLGRTGCGMWLLSCGLAPCGPRSPRSMRTPMPAVSIGRIVAHRMSSFVFDPGGICTEFDNKTSLLCPWPAIVCCDWSDGSLRGLVFGLNPCSRVAFRCVTVHIIEIGRADVVCDFMVGLSDAIYSSCWLLCDCACVMSHVLNGILLLPPVLRLCGVASGVVMLADRAVVVMFGNASVILHVFKGLLSTLPVLRICWVAVGVAVLVGSNVAVIFGGFRACILGSWLDGPEVGL